jgi:hypothetical protein
LPLGIVYLHQLQVLPSDLRVGLSAQYETRRRGRAHDLFKGLVEHGGADAVGVDERPVHIPEHESGHGGQYLIGGG